MEILSSLQKWYTSQCDRNWEHSSGITIKTTDNPGWWVEINLTGTSLENRKFEVVSKNVSHKLLDQAMGKVKPPFMAEEPSVKDDWMACFVQKNKFDGAGDSTKLEKILSLFLEWATE